MIVFKLLDRIITYVRILLNPVYPVFTPFEMLLFNKIKEMLSDEYKIIFDKQLSEVNYVQRSSMHEYIHFYKYGAFCSRQKYSIKFIESEAESVLLRFKMVIDNKDRINAELWQVRGELFGLEFKTGVIGCKNSTNITLTKL